MGRHVLTSPARADLFSIWEYVADRDGLDRADLLVELLHETMVKLADMPGMGHVREDLADVSLRVWAVRSFVIVYLPKTTPLQVVRILHGARDMTELFR